MSKQPAMKIEMRPAASLHPHPKNPKTHTEQQLQNISNSICRFGWTQPIVVDENGQILVGHGRWQAAGKEATVPVFQLPFTATEEQKLALLLVDNATNQETGFDAILTDQIMAALSAAEFPAQELGLMAEVLGESQERSSDQNQLKEAYEKYLSGEVMRLVLYYDSDTCAAREQQIEEIMRSEEIPAKGDLVMAMILEYEREHGLIGQEER